MTDTLKKPDIHRWHDDAGPNPLESLTGSTDAPPLSPIENSGTEHRSQWLPRLTLTHLARIVGASLAGLTVVVIVALTLIVSWLHDAAEDNAQWAEAETHLDHVHELATQQFLAATLAMRTGDGLGFVIENQGLEIAEDIDNLVSVVTEISGKEKFATLGDALHNANSSLTEAGVDGIAKILAGTAGADTQGVFELELAFASWRRAHNSFSEGMRSTQSAVLEDQSNQGETAFSALKVVGSFAVAVLVAAWYLGTRARKREASLKERVQDEKDLLHTIVNQLPESIAWKDSELRIQGCNPAMHARFRAAGVPAPFGKRLSDCDLDPALAQQVRKLENLEREVLSTGEAIHGHQTRFPTGTGEERTIIRTVVPLKHKTKTVGVVSTAQDVTTIVELERSLAAAGRLESIGQLAAGVAHEINTPVQFVSDNTAFLNDSFADVLGALNSLSELDCDCGAVESIRKESDLEFILEEIPDAIAQSLDGLGQIAQIVRAMKDFAHPGGDVGPADINRLITSTVDVSRNEWKYSAEMMLELDEDLPQPHCDEGQIKQVLLNMIVNAADAIADGDNDMGTITVATHSDEDSVIVKISDTGAGMTPETKARVFERFFTTKEVGRGSGQGLAIAHDAVTSHGGTIEVDSTVGVGTTFTIALPIKPAATDS